MLFYFFLELLLSFMIVLSSVDRSKGQDFEKCNFTAKVRVGKPYIVVNENFPDNYPRGKSCQWVVESDRRMRVACDPLEIPYVSCWRYNSMRQNLFFIFSMELYWNFQKIRKINFHRLRPIDRINFTEHRVQSGRAHDLWWHKGYHILRQWWNKLHQQFDKACLQACRCD